MAPSGPRAFQIDSRLLGQWARPLTCFKRLGPLSRKQKHSAACGSLGLARRSAPCEKIYSGGCGGEDGGTGSGSEGGGCGGEDSGGGGEYGSGGHSEGGGGSGESGGCGGGEESSG